MIILTFFLKIILSFLGTNGDATDPEHDAKTKAAGRNWETKKVPWMDELRASQAKKTSPGVGDFGGGKSLDFEPSIGHNVALEKTSNASFDMSKSFSSSYVSSTSSATASSQSVRKTTEFHNVSNVESKAPAAAAVGDVQIRANTEMARSMTGMSTNRLTFSTGNSEHATTLSTSAEKKPRPTSVNLRNRSISPIGRISTQSVHIASPPQSTAVNNNSANQTTTNAIIDPTTKALHVNNFVIADLPPSGSTNSSNHNTSSTPLTIENVCPRVHELEQKVSRLERLVQQQAQTIDDLMRTTRDESDKVKTLRGELDKYAQCVTQV